MSLGACGSDTDGSTHDVKPHRADTDDTAGDADDLGDSLLPSCAGVTCAGHGNCVLSGADPTCRCDEGFHAVGLSCVVDACTPTPHAESRCEQGNRYWFDSCGEREELHQSCGTWGCNNDACGALPSGWYPLGASELVRHDQLLLLDGTASGKGLGASDGARSELPCLTSDATGNIFVGWQQTGPTMGKVGLLRFRADGWQTVGAVGTNPAALNTATYGDRALALAAYGDTQVVAAWSAATTYGTSEIYVRRFDGERWLELDGSGSNGGISNTHGTNYAPRVVVDQDGNPIVAWTTLWGSSLAVWVQAYDGVAWHELGAGSATGLGVSQTTGAGYGLSLAIDADERAVVAWDDATSGNSEIYVRRFDGSAWVELAGSASEGGVSNNHAESAAPALAIGSDGEPAVAWQDDSGSYTQIYAKRYNGSAWVELGAGAAADDGISQCAGYARSPSLAARPDGQWLVAWADNTPAGAEIFVKQLTGSTWSELSPGSASGAGISYTEAESEFPQLRVTAGNEVVVTWEDYTNGYAEVYVRRLVGSTWLELNSIEASRGGISNNDGLGYSGISMVADAQDNLTVAWEDTSSGKSEIYLRHLSGDNWVELGNSSAHAGGVSNSDGNALAPSLALDSNDTPTIVWEDRSAYDAAGIFAMRFGGTNWTELSSGSASNNGVAGWYGNHAAPMLGVSGNTHFVVWSYDNTYALMRRYNGSSWTDVGTGSTSLTDNPMIPGGFVVWGLQMAITPDGKPVITYTHGDLHGSTPGEVFVRRFNGTAWEDVGAGSSDGTGISNTPDSSFPLAIAVDARGRIVVAWEESTATRTRLYLKRFDNGTWHELMASASGEGLAAKVTYATWANLAFDPDDEPVVTFTATTADNTEIYLKRFTGSGWAEIAGSASGGGISHSLGLSTNPKVVARSRDVCVTWSEAFHEQAEILVRCAAW